MGSPPPLLLLLLLLLTLATAARSDLAADRAALLSLRSAVGRSSKTMSHWNSSLPPCNWTRVACTSGRVSVLRLVGATLVGQIPDGILSNLTELRTLSLRSNALSGPLPPDLASLSRLHALYLQGNRFSGEIPDSILKLNRLVRLDLSGNDFSGRIPAGFNNLTRLATLNLASNRLSGELPDLNLPLLAAFNVSYNHLNGSIPARLRTMPANAFLNTSLCGEPLAACTGETSPAAAPAASGGGGRRRKLSSSAIAGIVVGPAVGFLFLVILSVFICKKKKRNSADVAAAKQAEAEVKRAVNKARAEGAALVPAPAAQGRKLVFFEKGPKGYDLEMLLRASAEVLGKGEFGTSYKAVMDNGTVVVVKRLRDVAVPEAEFPQRMEAIGAMRHPNLVALQAYFYSRDEKLLIYEHMILGSLSSLLHGVRGPSRTPLSWESRTCVALAAARGIEYIHSTSRGASHGNIKSSNILLSRLYDDIRVSEHGLTQLMGQKSVPSRATGYHAPEVTDTRKVSQKADVYSFGVLLLELLTGKAPAQGILNEDGVDLPRWVKSVVEEEWTNEVFDLELLRFQDREADMVQMLKLAIDCVGQYPDQRPSMQEVAARIEEIHQSNLSSADSEQQQQQQQLDDADDTSPLRH